MKTLLCLGLYTLTFVYIKAQQDPNAKAILDKLSAKTKTYECLEVAFTYSITTLKEGFDYSSDGTLVLKGDQYRLNLMGVETFFSGTTIWNYIIDANEVNITNPDPANQDFFLSNPKEVFYIYNTDYKYKLIGENSENGITYQEIDLYPINIDNSNYSRIKLIITKDQNQLHSIAAFAKNGNIYVVEINNFITNNIYEDNYFIFNKEDYPSVEIIDLR